MRETEMLFQVTFSAKEKAAMLRLADMVTDLMNNAKEVLGDDVGGMNKIRAAALALNAARMLSVTEDDIRDAIAEVFFRMVEHYTDRIVEQMAKGG